MESTVAKKRERERDYQRGVFGQYPLARYQIATIDSMILGTIWFPKSGARQKSNIDNLWLFNTLPLESESEWEISVMMAIFFALVTLKQLKQARARGA